MKKIEFAINYSIYQLTKLKDLPQLFLRLILAYGFYEPAMSKMNDIDAIASWFGDLDLPFPTLNAYLATYTEFFGFILLLAGLGTRWIALPLIITLIVAIKTVHWENGFAAGDSGFEIPLYYILMLFSLMIFGPGRLSADYLIKRYSTRQRSQASTIS
jgi:putative oxidoreductase